MEFVVHSDTHYTINGKNLQQNVSRICFGYTCNTDVRIVVEDDVK